MTPAGAERFVAQTMRALAIAFAVTGLLFLVTPDGLVGLIDDVGGALGGFADAPSSDQKLWLALSFAYMTVIAGVALVVARDPVRFAPMLLVLAVSKAASSLAALGFFLFHEDVFVYFLTFVVDAALAELSYACWKLASQVGRARHTTEDRTAARG